MYHKGTSIGRSQNSALRILLKSPWQFIIWSSGRRICNNAVCCWPTTSSNISIVNHNSFQGGLKVIDCTVFSAEYWCPNGTCVLIHFLITIFLLSLPRPTIAYLLSLQRCRSRCFLLGLLLLGLPILFLIFESLYPRIARVSII